ncbi:MAG TPA: NRDE family protein [Arachnia sp.]|nr:NRDE family protein [Arachnia sp.]HMT86362.1 NRDE family protein [Arachnia sp.]
MCTVVVETPQRQDQPTRLLAIRDEDPLRAWDPPGLWWPDAHPGVLGVRDRRAGGAWLACLPGAGRLAVLVNRGKPPAEKDATLASRGGLPLASLAGESLPARPRTEGFNLVEVDGGSCRITGWEGEHLNRQDLTPGVHMVAHGDVDDERTARIRRWLPEFRALAGLPEEQWRDRWLSLLRATTALGPFDDRAIVRDNHPHGIPTMSLLICVAEIRPGTVALDWTVLPTPGTWTP